MASQFADRMSRAPDEELIRIASSTESEGYQDEAIEAAKLELNQRGLDDGWIKEVELDAEADREREGRRAEIPLSNLAWAALVVVGPFCIWPAIVLSARGYRQKSRDAWHAMLVGFVFWGVVSVAMSMLLS